MKKYLVIDGNNILNWVYWKEKNKKGVQRNSHQYLFYFLYLLKSYVKLFNPKEIIVCWDKRDTSQGYDISFRKKILSSYKENREENKEEKENNVYSHISTLNDILNCLGVKQLYPKQFEADDIMYYLSNIKYPDRCIIVTRDTDMYQLVNNKMPNNIVYNPKKKIIITSFLLRQEFDVEDGYQFIIQKSLKGDRYDNIKGITGIRKSKIKDIINVLGEDLDIDTLKKVDILNEEEIKIFERNLKLMYLDEIRKHPDELCFYQESLQKEVICDKNKFREIIKILGFWSIIKKFDEWYDTFSSLKKDDTVFDLYELFNE